jgi:PKD repeat protein
MKKLIYIFVFFILCPPSFAGGIKGGWISYQYLGPIPGSGQPSSLYRINVYQYSDCLSNEPPDPEVYVGLFNPVTSQISTTVRVPLAETVIETKSSFGCINNPSAVCYRIDKYEIKGSIIDNEDGYVLAAQRCCRIGNVVNVANSGTLGTTYTTKIPAKINGVLYRNNASPVFAQNDTALVCHNEYFTLDFSATDIDGDELRYSFVNGYYGGDATPAGARPNPPVMPFPPYDITAVLPYTTGYSGSSPLGPGVTIDPSTGIISGIAPATAGTYVVAVAVEEYRNRVLIGTTRKEIHIDVGNCNVIAADPVCSSCSVVTSPVNYFTNCNSFTTSFFNAINSPLISTYYWDFGVPSQTNDTSTLANPTFTYPDTGTYVLTLVLNRGQPCHDSSTRIIKIYPGFVPDFNFSGVCKNTQIQFTDKTATTYGVVNSWSWNFGDQSTVADTPHSKNPQYSYSIAGSYPVSLMVTSDKGCVDSVSKVIDIKDQPALTVTNDTLICSIDTLQLNARGTGTVLWTPNYSISNQNNSSPFVSPDVPTKYYVTLTDASGCVAKDSVFVDVKLFVTIDAGRDTGICAGDAIQLNPVSDALHYKWSPSAPLNNDTAKYPIAMPAVTTMFYVIGNIGKCQSTDSVKVRAAPYPGVGGIPDTTICFGSSIQFNETGGSMYTWSPSFFLNNPYIPDPIAKPDRSIPYIVTITDTLGCPKPSFDTVVVTVQKVVADAGPRDTSILVNQSLQLNATGGQFYLWTPSTGLNNNTIPNPVATLNDNQRYLVTVSNASGCFATDTINVTVYKFPGLYVPNAFTPNGDGLNDVFRPIGLGIKQINYFKIYNRWGQLMFSTKQGMGWDF